MKPSKGVIVMSKKKAKKRIPGPSGFVSFGELRRQRFLSHLRRWESADSAAGVSLGYGPCSWSIEQSDGGVDAGSFGDLDEERSFQLLSLEEASHLLSGHETVMVHRCREGEFHASFLLDIPAEIEREIEGR